MQMLCFHFLWQCFAGVWLDCWCLIGILVSGMFAGLARNVADTINPDWLVATTHLASRATKLHYWQIEPILDPPLMSRQIYFHRTVSIRVISLHGPQLHSLLLIETEHFKGFCDLFAILCWCHPSLPVLEKMSCKLAGKAWPDQSHFLHFFPPAICSHPGLCIFLTIYTFQRRGFVN